VGGVTEAVEVAVGGEGPVRPLRAEAVVALEVVGSGAPAGAVPVVV